MTPEKSSVFTNRKYSPGAEDLERALAPLILSASGWRKIFAEDGDEESLTSQVGEVDQFIACVMAGVFAKFLSEGRASRNQRLAVGMDSRPTGEVLADRMLRSLLANGVEVAFLGVVAAPEIMAWVQASPELDGFVYISASHNPPGHNGVKFGLEEGGVVGGPLAQSLISAFREAATPEKGLPFWRAAAEVPDETVRGVLRSATTNRKASRSTYLGLAREILSSQSRSALIQSLRRTPAGVVAEFNGSARSTSIDKDFLAELGVQVLAFNETPGCFAHRIIPEGSSLDLCRQKLEEAHEADPRFVLGYVPDCDGDRGNVVWYDDRKKRAEILEAQEVFALCVLSELAGLVHDGILNYDEDGHPHERVAVVCNDPTSLRIDRIARTFGAQVFRAEVGEANVVGLARRLRAEGWIVRILGEGSNGGNITYPGAVRDPLSTLGSLLKLVWLRDTRHGPGLFTLWRQRSGFLDPSPDFTLADVLAALPGFRTTPISEDRAMLKIRTLRHDHLKAAYEKRFLNKEWKEKSEWLKQRFDIWTWEEINYEGMEERRGFGPPFRSGNESGGFKLVWKNREGESIGFSWMRGSGTEPVFRVLVDIAGTDPALETELLDWHVGILRAVD